MNTKYLGFLTEVVDRNTITEWNKLFNGAYSLTCDINSETIIADLPQDLSHKYHDLLKKYGIRGKNYTAPIEYETVEMRLP